MYVPEEFLLSRVYIIICMYYCTIGFYQGGEHSGAVNCTYATYCFRQRSITQYLTSWTVSGWKV